jgi:hypothetical protein
MDIFSLLILLLKVLTPSHQAEQSIEDRRAVVGTYYSAAVVIVVPMGPPLFWALSSLGIPHTLSLGKAQSLAGVNLFP